VQLGRYGALVQEAVADSIDFGQRAQVRAVGTNDVAGMDDENPGGSTPSAESVDSFEQRLRIVEAVDEAVLEVDVQECRSPRDQVPVHDRGSKARVGRRRYGTSA